jgi:UDP-glucuronate 4-epimerase
VKKVLVTGIAGFIAATTARQLLEAGVEVVGVDNMNDYYDPRLKEHRLEMLRRVHSFEFHKMDIENFGGLEKIFSSHSFDAVFNLAARAGVRYSMAHPDVYFSTNTMGTLNILKLMKTHAVPKIVLASTSSLYAGEKIPFSEDLPVNTPISPYAASKKGAEAICYTYHAQYKIDCTIARYFTVYGPAGRPDMSPYRFIYWIDHGMPVNVFGDGEQTRDFTFVDDIARGTILAARPLGYEIINLGGGKTPISLNQMIRMIEEELGKNAIVNYQPVQKADMTDTQADIRKAKKLLDWSPEFDFQKGLHKTIQWYKENKKLVDQVSIAEKV